MVYEFLGVSTYEWAERGEVMKEFGIPDAKALRKRLKEAQAKVTDEARIEVRDAGNQGRLLGTLPIHSIPCGPDKGQRVSFAVMPKIPAGILSDRDAALSVRTVVMEYGFLYDERSFVKRAFLHTTAGLDDLVRLRGFRLPNETAEEAAQRLGML